MLTSLTSPSRDGGRYDRSSENLHGEAATNQQESLQMTRTPEGISVAIMKASALTEKRKNL